MYTGYSGAGIGGGEKADGGQIAIYDGTVTANGSYYSAGIGGGSHGSGGYITIYNGTVSVNSRYGGVGMGDSDGQNASRIDIYNGEIFTNANKGIGFHSNNSSLYIAGEAAVICGNSNCQTANTDSHKYYNFALAADGKIFGIPVPDGWTWASAYIVPVTLTFHPNGGSGGTKITQHIGTQATMTDGSNFNNGVFVVRGWNTEPDGSGEQYEAGSAFTMNRDTTLYAVWGKEPVANVLLSSHEETLSTENSIKLAAAVLPSGASYPLVSWKSSNPAVASVNKNGTVTALKSGRAIITATADGVSDECEIIVKQLAEGINIRPQSQTLAVGATAVLTATVAPEDTTDPGVTWESSDTAVATVDAKGVVKGVGAGKALITASANGNSDICEVYVSAVTINVKLSVGNTLELIPALSQDADGSDAVWKSSNTNVATVDEDGIVTAVGEGSAVITLKFKDAVQTVGIFVDMPDIANDDSVLTDNNILNDDSEMDDGDGTEDKQDDMEDNPDA